MAMLLLRLAAFLLCSIVVVSGSNALLSPAMVWSNSRCSSSQQQHRVDYQVLSPKSMATAVYSEFRSIHEQCKDEPVDLFVEFVGNELRSSDLARDIPTVNVLKGFFSSSGGVLSLPYVSNKNDGSFLANVLLDEINPEAPSAVYGCPGASNNMKDLQSFQDVEEYIKSRRRGGEPAYLVVCSSPSTVGTSQSEGEALKNILSIVEEASLGYMAVYASDPYATRNYRSIASRLLASNDTPAGSQANSNASVSGSRSSNSSGNGTAPYCDEVCQTKATLLEAIFVTIVLLVILVSGLCCMMGIQTPVRFEKPHES